MVTWVLVLLAQTVWRIMIFDKTERAINSTTQYEKYQPNLNAVAI
jgi:hypothetical protein